MTTNNTGLATDEAMGKPKLGIVGIGASAGGLEAIREMLSTADPDGPLAFVVIQHLDPNHQSLLAELLGRHTRLPVVQAAGEERVEAGKAYIIPPGHGLRIERGVLKLFDFDQPRGLRRPIDDFFESLAIDQGRLASCVILSGTGADGSVGLRAIKEMGGICVVQDPATAKYDGMPVSAQNTGLVDFIRSPDRIIECLTQFYGSIVTDPEHDHLSRSVPQVLGDICAVIEKTCGHDFSGYKQSTLVRRIQRRIQVLDLRDPVDYLRRVRADAQECETLFRDLLINVTRFFRDGEYFDLLRREVVGPMVTEAAKGRGEIRIWVPGCSSGEEAYSLAMMFADEMRVQNRRVNLQLFATDIDDKMLGIAREGIYPHGALADVPEQMRDLYTISRDGSFRVAPGIREMIRFSLHSVVRDPPFSNIDLLSCRNLLIYFDAQLQGVALPIFHYALRPGGALFLGPSETLGRFDHLFDPIDSQSRIFRRGEGRPQYPVQLRAQGGRTPAPEAEPLPNQQPGKRATWSDDTLTERVLNAYAPPTLQVSARGEILKATGRLGKYLELRPEAREALFAPSVARPGVREAISAIIRKVSATGQRTIVRDLEAVSEFGRQSFELIAEPGENGAILLVFRERNRFEAVEDEDMAELEPSDSHVQSLEDELRATRERLHVTVEELETANEELKSSNEEMMSMNEELQSTNEELSTVNDELKSKVDELSVANADLSNFFASTSLPLVVVDSKMHIRNFTDAIGAIYPFRMTDRDRPLSEVTSKLTNDRQVVDLTEEVIAGGEIRHLRVRAKDSRRTWSLVVTPYHSREGRADGATLVFTELTEAIRLEEALMREGERLRLALDVANLGVWEFNPDTGILNFDDTGQCLMGAGMADLGLRDFLSCVDPADLDTVREAMRLEDSEQIDVQFAVAGTAGAGRGDQPRFVQVVGRRVASARQERFLGVVFDVTEEHEAARIREMMLREMNHRVKNMFSIISGMLRIAGRNTKDVPTLIRGVESRINALSRSHDMTQRSERGATAPVQLREVVELALRPYLSGTEIQLDGPDISVESHELTALALIFHEWATNAAKYGVLGPVSGDLRVSWSMDEKKMTLVWNETYDSHVDITAAAPGFGSTLVQLSSSQLQGAVETETTETYRRMILSYEPEHGQK